MNGMTGGQKWKGIILAAGSGTRLYPVTRAVNKQLLCVYDKPMIYYPLSVLMLAGIRDILFITTFEDLPRFEHLFGNGASLGLRISYAVQPRPDGIPQAFTIGRDFIGDDKVCLVLGDNVFYGHGLSGILQRAARMTEGGVIFGCQVKDPERYGVIEFDLVDGAMRVRSLEEKPRHPRTNYAVPGLYFFDNRVVDVAPTLKASARGETEITDIIKFYMESDELTVELLGRGFAWLDTGTHESLLEASTFIETIEKRQGLKVACIEEIAYRMGYIDASQVRRLADPLRKNGYGAYLMRVLEEQPQAAGVFA